MLNDLRHAVRSLAHAPGFTATVVAVLALGIGATTAIFSVVDAVLLHPFPYRDADRITFIGSNRRGNDGTMPVTYPDFLDWRRQAHSFSHLAYASNHTYTLTDVAEPARIEGAQVSADAWPVLGLAPMLGRVFTPAEDRPGADRVCVVSASLWQTRFGSDPNILQRTLTLDGHHYTVIGVMPPRFKFWGADLWTPVGLEAGTDLMQSRVVRMNSWVVGKLTPGVTIAQAQTELDLITAQLAHQYPDSNKGVGAHVSLLSQSVTGPMQRPLLVLLGAVGCVLLIACANVANLLLARATSREKEFAVRLALGASRTRLVGQQLLEALPLAVGGGLVGLLAAVWGVHGLLYFLPPDVIPAEARIQINAPVMLFAAGLAIGSTLLFALLPAWEGSRQQTAESLKDGMRGTSNRRTRRLRAALIVGEVALSFTLLVAAGLLIRSFARLQSVDPGFRTDHLLVVPVSLTEERYPTGHQGTQFFTTLLERAATLPGVEAVATSNNIPFRGGAGFPLVTAGQTYTDVTQLQSVQFFTVQGDYFRAQGLRLVSGRVFQSSDDAAGAPVIILNEAAVRKFLPEGNPLGKQVMLGAPDNLIKPGMLPPGLDHFHWSTVVGVVADVRQFSLQSQAPAAAYIPVQQSWDVTLFRNNMTLLVRTSGDPLLAAGNIRQLVANIDRDQPVDRIQSMEMIVADSLRQSRFNTILLGLFAALALVLAAVGIYAVVAWNVTQRTREIGIRAALGANRGDVVRLVVVGGMRVVLIGLAIGLAAAFALTRLLQSLLFEVGSFDPVTITLVSTVLAGIALLACYLPARRAARVDPMVALRME